MAELKISQYTYFAVCSQTLSCKEIESKVGIVGDQHNTLGERRHQHAPSKPVINSWEIVCKDNIPVDEQIEAVVTRLKPVAPALQKLVETGDVRMFLQVVRYLDDEEVRRRLLVPTATS